ncbi:aa3 type cytochrome c oxidase subunit IV [Cognatiyoonia sediminum]|uniref:Aa3 type cytochrome c oxidase subunit IV n=1 Tax=Cognatiyoonia sediminum TaxID=1508389 RepID=A0A1M5PWJ2_9RHOB|nr:aa3-type cytochrome c oxidase subunit IV [Cognatiyoonia sediminum]SHH06056.1 aa3 type cytochrome c oxidase subunit IV [Cognatiyoonia sediminum]
MAEHKHGEMDISVQEKTFEGFISMTTKATIVILLILVFLALVGA